MRPVEQISRDLQVMADEIQAERTMPFKRDDEGYATITFKIKGDALYSLLKLLKQCEYNGNIGHSHHIIVDPEGGQDRKRSVGFDGDGQDRIKDILVNGEPLDEKFEW